MSARLPIQHLQQAPRIWKDRLPNIAAGVGEAAWEGYAADGHGQQSCAELHRRGGFDYAELGYYLARAVDEGRARVEVVARGDSFQDTKGGA